MKNKSIKIKARRKVQRYVDFTHIFYNFEFENFIKHLDANIYY